MKLPQLSHVWTAWKKGDMNNAVDVLVVKSALRKHRMRGK